MAPWIGTQIRIGANEPAKSRPCCPSVRVIDETGRWTLGLLIHFLKSLEKSKTTPQDHDFYPRVDPMRPGPCVRGRFACPARGEMLARKKKHVAGFPRVCRLIVAH